MQGVGGKVVGVSQGAVRSGPSSPRRDASLLDTQHSRLWALPNELIVRIMEVNTLTQVNHAFNQVAYSEKRKHVFHLDLTKYKTDEGMKAILKKLRSVDKIKITGLNKEGKFEQFNRALSRLGEVNFNTIQCDLSGNRLTKDQFSQINNALLSKMTGLKSLNLHDNNIGSEGASAIAQSEHMKQLTLLDIGWNNIGDDGASAIAQSEHMKQLTSLNLSDNNIGDDGAMAIAQSEHMKQLTSLDLRSNNIGDAGKNKLRDRFRFIRV